MGAPFTPHGTSAGSANPLRLRSASVPCFEDGHAQAGNSYGREYLCSGRSPPKSGLRGARMTTDPLDANAGPPGIRVVPALRARDREVLSSECLAFVLGLARAYAPRVDQLLAARRAMQERYDAGERPRFLEETRGIRESQWMVAP